MPSLTTANLAVPVVCMENMIASIELRVLGPTPDMHPGIAFNQKPKILMAMPGPTPHPCDLPSLIQMCLDHEWPYRVCDEIPTRLLTSSDPVYLIRRSSSYVANPHLAPFSSPASYWKTRQTETGNSIQTYSLIHSSLTPTKHDLCANACLTWQTRCNTPASTDSLNDRLDSLLESSCATTVRPRQTPLRNLVEEFLRCPEMSWMKEPLQPMEFEKWVKRFPNWRRDMLRTARDLVLREGITERDAVVKNFVKRETSHKYTDPRNISPRSDKYVAVMGPYIAAIEARSKTCPFLIKGLTPAARAIKMHPLVGFRHFVEIDYTRYDQSINLDILRIFEHKVLRAPFSGDHLDYLTCLRLAQTTKGVSQFGTRYTVEGTRCSGDVHTSIANGLLGRFLLWVCLRKLPPDSWCSFHEGDDGAVGVHPDVLDQVVYNLQFLSCLGFNAKIKVCDNLEEVMFCGRRLIPTSKGITSICDVTRTLRKFNTTTSLGPTDLLLYAKALSYHYTDGDTPLIGALTHSVAQVLSYCRTKYSRRQLRNAMMRAHNERWVLRDNPQPILWTKALNTKPPDVAPESCAAVMEYDTMTYRTIQDLSREYLSWVDVGFIPNEVTKVALDWCPEPDNVFTIGPTSTWAT